MRNELERIENIQRFLAGELSAEERAIFDRELADNPGLQEELRLQQALLRGIQRITWKEKIGRARKRYWRQQRFFKGGAAGFGLVIVAGVIVWALRTPTRQVAMDNRHQRENTVVTVAAGKTKAFNHVGDTTSGVLSTPADRPLRQNVPGQTIVSTAQSSDTGGMPMTSVQLPAEADKALPVQRFRIDAMRDTVLETQGGILLSIPAGSFLEKDGRITTGILNLVVREALTPAAIMQAGLSTLSGGNVLETGGMFFVDASKEGKALDLDSVKGIYAEIPTDSARPGMQLYSGKQGADGVIDWIDPRQLTHDLVPVDIHLLNFYPPGYLDSLAHWGYDSHNKKFTDSLYYSFAQFFAPGNDDNRYGEGKIFAPGTERSRYADPIDQISDTTKSTRPPSLPCGLNPARIKAIWNESFRNTLISTREFEERLPWIHRSDNEALLNLYVQHLDKPLYIIDSLAARLLRSKNASLSARFLTFYSRHDGRANISSRQLDDLRAYYEEKVRVFTEAIAKTERAFWDKQAALDREADQERQAHETDSSARENRNFNEELAFNLRNICRQLGYDPAIVRRPPTKNSYKVRLGILGWCNIDRATRERVSFTVVDEQTNRTAHIDYQSASIRVAQYQRYDRVYSYLLPDQLSSFIRLSGASGTYMGKLNAAMRYDLVCIGYKGEQAFYYYQKDLTSGDHPPVELDSIRQEELKRRLNAIASRTQAADLERENAYFRFEIRDQERRKAVEKIMELQCMILRKFFPCIELRVNRCQLAE